MARFDFCGATYQSIALSSDAQWCMNRYPEQDQGNGGKGSWILLPTPGQRTFANLPMSSISSGFAFKIGATERSFSVGSDGALYEIFTDGTFINRGAVAAAPTPGRIAATQTQLLVQAGGKLYRYTLATNNLSAALNYSDASSIPAISDIGMVDGYFAALIANSNKWQISNLLDANTWDPADVAQVSYFPDNVVSMIIDHRDIIFLGEKQAVPYYNNGNADFPFAPVPGGFMEKGSSAVLGAIKLDNTVYWIEKDERGGMTAQKLNGYTPQRVSTHAIEQAWQSYPTTNDLVSYSFQLGGHAFWHIYFPTAGKSWRFDAATQLWHEVGYWNLNTGSFNAHRSQCHWVFNGKHLVGDWASGQIYEMSSAFYDDAGNPIRRVRRSPYVAREGAYITFNSIEFEVDSGLGLAVGQGSDPKLMLRWSDDAGHTWSNERLLSVGKQGEFGKRVRDHMLGTCWGTKGRIWEVADSEPIPLRITDAYLDADPEYKSTERMAVQARKGA